MSTPDEIVDYYLDEFRNGRPDNAYHSLIEADSAVIPELLEAYKGEVSLDTRVFVIEVISAFRLQTSLTFLRRALRADEPEIWKPALDGIVLIGSSEALDTMNHVLASTEGQEKRAWIEEAITDIRAGV